eukprot:scaffold26118_cov29-Tisochrysis_lutea.AAC.2
MACESAPSPTREISRWTPMVEACGSASSHGLSATSRASRQRVRLPFTSAVIVATSNVRVWFSAQQGATPHGDQTSARAILAKGISTHDSAERGLSARAPAGVSAYSIAPLLRMSKESPGPAAV